MLMQCIKALEGILTINKIYNVISLDIDRCIAMTDKGIPMIVSSGYFKKE